MIRRNESRAFSFYFSPINTCTKIYAQKTKWLFDSYQNALSPSGRANIFLKWKLRLFVIYCVAFPRNYNISLARQQNSVPVRRKINLFFYRGCKYIAQYLIQWFSEMHPWAVASMWRRVRISCLSPNYEKNNILFKWDM